VSQPMSLAMTVDEREAFLAGVHVGVISVSTAGRGPLTVPIWYAYEPGGEVQIWISSDSRKAKLLQAAGRFSLCVQQETRPYKYVSVEGPVLAIEPIDLERDLQPLIYRHLGPAEGDQYIAELGGSAAGEGDIVVRTRPEHWLSEDFSKRDR
jgi:hypothetical protein